MIEARVIISRPIGEVFGFYRDFRNLPAFLGDVMLVEPIDSVRSRWTIQGPLRTKIQWIIKITREKDDDLIFYETTGSPTFKGRWEVYFYKTGLSGKTMVREIMAVPFGRIGRMALALVGKDPEKEVRANLNRLKQFMETGKVIDASYAVPGKFPHSGK